MDSTERLVMRYLIGRREIMPAHDIQIDCRDFWTMDGIWHSPMTYNRAWQRLVQHGRVKVKRVRYNCGAKIFTIVPVTHKQAKILKPIPHGECWL